MATPGEVHQHIGRAYARVLCGCLELVLRDFRTIFDVETSPAKLSFNAPTGSQFSFDAKGIFFGPSAFREVLIESKGHKDGSQLLDAYKEFLAKAYITTVSYASHREDYFWFVTNVPFGATVGKKLTHPEFILSALTDNPGQGVAKILGAAHVDAEFVKSLAERLSVCILTDSFLKLVGVSYHVGKGENLWRIIKMFHADKISAGEIVRLLNTVKKVNSLKDIDRIQAGQPLQLPWKGIEWD